MKNNYEIREDTVVIFLTSRLYGSFETVVSLSELPRLQDFKGRWGIKHDDRIPDRFYVRSGISKSADVKKVLSHHRWLTNAPDDLVVDHINHNTLDNTNSNLRLIYQYQNLQNRKGASKNCKSGERGVCWKKQIRKWVSQISVNGTRKHIGYFEKFDDAVKAVKEERLKIMKYSTN